MGKRAAHKENFQVDLAGVLELLSEHLYSSPDVFVRELLQNAVDAITARGRTDDAPPARIAFECNARSRTLTVIDNGVGLSECEARDFLARVGASLKRGADADRTTFLGQFGVGILSCFLVASELVVLTRRLGDAGPGVRWTAWPDGRFRLEPLDTELSVGTRVVLRMRSDARRYAASATINALAERFGRYLETPIFVDDWQVNDDRPPWTFDRDDAEQRASLLREFEFRHGRPALDVVGLDDAALGLRGVAFVLPELPANAAEQVHELYLRGMFVTDRPGALLPRWAGFTRCVLCSDRLRPTASRESFCEDAHFAAVGESVAQRLREYLARLARTDRPRLATILEFQDQAFRQLALDDAAFFDAVIDLLPFETSLGRMTFGDFRREHAVVRIAATSDQFRSLAALAAARGTIVFNGGYTHHAELLEHAVARDPSLSLEPLDGRDLIEQLGQSTGPDAAAFTRITPVLEAALTPFGVTPRLARYEPDDLPAVYGEDADSNLARALRAAREMSRGLWSELLDAATAGRPVSEQPAVLCFNAANPVVRRLLAGAPPDVIADTARLLYVQALLLSQQPLTSEETGAFSAALGAMLTRSVGGPEEQP